jgi:hypothetical protein
MKNEPRLGECYHSSPYATVLWRKDLPLFNRRRKSTGAQLTVCIDMNEVRQPHISSVLNAKSQAPTSSYDEPVL